MQHIIAIFTIRENNDIFMERLISNSLGIFCITSEVLVTQSTSIYTN